jgi:hypothetical protein
VTDSSIADYVVDTNVWALSSRPIADLSREEIPCYWAALQWLRTFATSTNRLRVDSHYLVLGEYRRNIREDSETQRILNDLERRPTSRLIGTDIQLTDDPDPVAIVPEVLHILDRSDRKFVAVALAVDPHPPIINATDTDWAKAKDYLTGVGLVVQELCPDYIQAHLRA